MVQKTKIKTAEIAVIDIGSNSVRLVVYRVTGRAHTVTFEKKTTCGLARSMSQKNPKLNRKGMAQALKALRKFNRVLKKRKIKKVLAIGTAAMRMVAHTSAGRKFHRRAEKALGHRIKVITGHREARLTALGVMSALPKASGICGDLGGGSLELASIRRGRVGHSVTLALGSLTLVHESKQDPLKAGQIMHARLNRVAWLGRTRARVFYPIGGSWRAVGRIMRKMHHDPPQRIHGFAINARTARRFALIIERQKPSKFRKMPRKIRQRADVIPYAAAVLAELIARIRPKKIIFSAHGVREGLLRSETD